MSSANIFKGRNVLIATKHKKEKVIAPLLEKELGVHCFTDPELDTDLFGTFSGEVARKEDPISTARNKCLLAMERNNCDIAVASEGSIGPHPSLYFVASDDEFLLLVDKKYDLEIMVREISTATNFNGSEIATMDELLSFAKNAQFPSHGLIIKKGKEDVTAMVKGITNVKRLQETFLNFTSIYGGAFVETDMRAMYNPSRMKVIKEATKKLVAKIKSQCHNCSTPGFGVVDVKRGLPCECCNAPTRSTLSHVYGCVKCYYTEERKFPHGKTKEEPTFCDYCNP